jgi:hypothetical protein
MLLVIGHAPLFVPTFNIVLVGSGTTYTLSGASLYGTENLAGLSGLVFLFAAPGERTDA